MRRMFAVLSVVVASLFGVVGVAAAEQVTYEFSDSWQLAYIDGRPTVLPEMEDDVVEIKCWRSDQMIDWKANNEELVAGSWPRTDGTGIQVQPHFTGQTETLTLTISCQRD